MLVSALPFLKFIPFLFMGLALVPDLRRYKNLFIRFCLLTALIKPFHEYASSLNLSVFAGGFLGGAALGIFMGMREPASKLMKEGVLFYALFSLFLILTLGMGLSRVQELPLPGKDFEHSLGLLLSLTFATSLLGTYLISTLVAKGILRAPLWIVSMPLQKQMKIQALLALLMLGGYAILYLNFSQTLLWVVAGASILEGGLSFFFQSGFLQKILSSGNDFSITGKWLWWGVILMTLQEGLLTSVGFLTASVSLDPFSQTAIVLGAAGFLGCSIFGEGAVMYRTLPLTRPMTSSLTT